MTAPFSATMAMKVPPTFTSTSFSLMRICFGRGRVPYIPVPQTNKLLVVSSEMAADDYQAEMPVMRRLLRLSIFTGL